MPVNVDGSNVMTVDDVIAILQALPEEQRALPAAFHNDGSHAFIDSEATSVGKPGRVERRWPHYSVWSNERGYDEAIPAFII